MRKNIFFCIQERFYLPLVYGKTSLWVIKNSAGQILRSIMVMRIDDKNKVIFFY